MSATCNPLSGKLRVVVTEMVLICSPFIISDFCHLVDFFIFFFYAVVSYILHLCLNLTIFDLLKRRGT